MAHALEPAFARLDMSLEDFAHFSAQTKVGMANDGLGHVGNTAAVLPGHRGNEFSFANRLEGGGPIHSITRLSLHVDRCDDVVACARVAQEVVNQVGPGGSVEEVMMGVDDVQARLKDLLLLQSKPIGANGEVVGPAHLCLLGIC